MVHISTATVVVAAAALAAAPAFAAPIATEQVEARAPKGGLRQPAPPSTTQATLPASSEHSRAATLRSLTPVHPSTPVHPRAVSGGQDASPMALSITQATLPVLSAPFRDSDSGTSRRVAGSPPSDTSPEVARPFAARAVLLPPPSVSGTLRRRLICVRSMTWRNCSNGSLTSMSLT
ncbi:hypothetical protein DFP72DRAFT_904134, partial [Ephemerocybe angulata]